MLNDVDILEGIRTLKFPFVPYRLIVQNPHEKSSMRGWIGLVSWTVASADCSVWDVDLRFAFGSEIFKQHLIDHGWNEAKLLYRHKWRTPKRHKAILYICAYELGICEPKWQRIEPRYCIDKYWQTIWRGTLSHENLPKLWDTLLPIPLPVFSEIPFVKFAITSQLFDKPPTIQNNFKSDIKTILRLPTHERRKGEGGLRTRGLYKHPKDGEPFITIITVVFNNVGLLEQTIQSIINIDSNHLEYIIIDGGSTDGTVDLIRKYEDQIDYWISEPDEGLYDAMNKGIATAIGDWLLFINSDDCIVNPKALDDVLNLEKIEAFCFKTVNLGKYYNWLRPCRISSDINQYSHQSIVMKKKIYYRLSYRFCSDIDYLKKYQDSFVGYSCCLSAFRMEGESSKVTLQHLKEYHMLGNPWRIPRVFAKHLIGFCGLEIIKEYLQMAKQKMFIL